MSAYPKRKARVFRRNWNESRTAPDPWIGTQRKESNTKKAESYQPRLDIWGAISYHKPLAVDIQTSEDRKKKGVKGYGKNDVRDFLRKKVAPQLSKMHGKFIVCMDRGFHFTADDVEDELKRGGATNVEDIWIFPTMVASCAILWTTHFGIQ